MTLLNVRGTLPNDHLLKTMLPDYNIEQGYQILTPLHISQKNSDIKNHEEIFETKIEIFHDNRISNKNVINLNLKTIKPPWKDEEPKRKLPNGPKDWKVIEIINRINELLIPKIKISFEQLISYDYYTEKVGILIPPACEIYFTDKSILEALGFNNFENIQDIKLRTFEQGKNLYKKLNSTVGYINRASNVSMIYAQKRISFEEYLSNENMTDITSEILLIYKRGAIPITFNKIVKISRSDEILASLAEFLLYALNSILRGIKKIPPEVYYEIENKELTVQIENTLEESGLNMRISFNKVIQDILQLKNKSIIHSFSSVPIIKSLSSVDDFFSYSNPYPYYIQIVNSIVNAPSIINSQHENIIGVLNTSGTLIYTSPCILKPTKHLYIRILDNDLKPLVYNTYFNILFNLDYNTSI